MRTLRKRILRISAVTLAAVLFLVIAGSLYLYFHTPTLKGLLERTLSKKPGLTVEIGRLSYRILPFRAVAESVQVVFAGKPGRADVRIGRATASGRLRRLIKQKKPFFDTLTISGLDVEFVPSPDSTPSEPAGIRDLARLVSENLEYVGALVVADAALRVPRPGAGGLDVSASGVSLKAGMTDMTALDLIVTKLIVRSAQPVFTLTAHLRAEATWPRTGPFSLAGSLDLTSASLSLPERSWEVEGFSLKTGFRAVDQSVAFTAFHLDVPEIATLSGTGRAEWGRNSLMTATTILDIPNLERAKKMFASFLPPALPVFTFDGPAHWEGDLKRETASGTAKVTIDGALRLPPARFLMKQAGLSVDQVLQAELHLQDGPDGLRIEGFAEGRPGRWVAGPFQAEGVSFRLPIDYAGRRVNSASLKAQVRELTLQAGNRKLKLADISIGGPMSLDGLGQTLEIGSLSIDVPGLGGFGLSGELGLKAPRRIDLSVKCGNLDVGEILRAFPYLVPRGVTAWKPEGRFDLSLEIRNEPADPGRYQVRGTGDLTRFAFQDSSGSLISEGLEPRMKFEAAILSFDQEIPFSLHINLAKGESLWKDVYFNWQNTPVRLELKGTLDPRFRKVRDATAAVFFPPLGEIRAEGSMNFGPIFRSDLHLAAPSIDLASLHSFLVKTSPGRLSGWEIQGRAEAEVDLRLGTSFEVQGKFRVREASANNKDGTLKIAGLDSDFPFSISRGGRPAGRRSEDSLSPGHIMIRSMETPIAAFGPHRLDFYSTRNLFLFFPVEIILWGSRLQLGQSVLAVNPSARTILGVSNLTLTDLDFSRLPSSESFKLAGRASIPTCEMEIRPGVLRLMGPLRGELFGGRLTVDDIRVTDAFSAGRRIAFQAQIESLDVEKFTASIPFGEVTGIVDVSLRDFALSYGQPENFDLSIVSVPRKGVSRTFSLKAVNSLSIISSAGSAAAPSNNLLMRLLPSFGYSRIGIACSLKNDVFTLQGTIVEGGIQYLVRRSALFGIDVVNGNPINKIGFKDMIERIKRVGQDQGKK